MAKQQPASAPGAEQEAERARRQESFLRREGIIRNAGILLTLSPIGNFLMSAAFAGVPGWWRLGTLAMFAGQISFLVWLLWASAFAVGVMMLRGRRASWVFPLAILGVNVIFGFATLKNEVAGGRVQSLLFLATNLALFGLIYMQEFHQRLERKLRDAAARRALNFAIHCDIRLDFEGIGVWGRITEITHAALRVRLEEGFEAPADIEKRAVEFEIGPDFYLEARFYMKMEEDYVFHFVELTLPERARFRSWAQQLAARSRAAA